MFINQPDSRISLIAYRRYIHSSEALWAEGKSAFLVMEILQLCLDFPGNRGAIFRWENKTFSNTTLKTMMDFYPDEIIRRWRKSDQIFELVNGSEILYGGLKPSGSSNPIDRIKSMNLGCFGIDEASEVPEDFFLILCSRLRLTLPGIKVVYKGICTSNPEPGWVHRRFVETKQRDHIFIPALAKDNPYNPPGYEARLRRIFPQEWIDQYVDGDWLIAQKGLYVFPYAWVRTAQQRSVDEGTLSSISLDIGAGGDPTVAVGRWGNIFRILHKSQFIDTMVTVGELTRVLDKYKPPKIIVDVVGLGKPIYDRLHELKYPVAPYNAGWTALDPERFADRRSEDHWRLRELIELEEVDLPDIEDVTSELVSVKYEIRSEKVIKVESKKTMRARGISSPNILDAFTMALSDDDEEEIVGGVLTTWAGRERIMENVRKLEENNRRAETAA